MSELEFQTSDEKQAELTERYGLILLQFAMIVKRHAIASDAEALNFFQSSFDEIIKAGRELLKQKAH
jgi:hypothetical protein